MLKCVYAASGLLDLLRHELRGLLKLRQSYHVLKNLAQSANGSVKLCRGERETVVYTVTRFSHVKLELGHHNTHYVLLSDLDAAFSARQDQRAFQHFRGRNGRRHRKIGIIFR